MAPAHKRGAPSTAEAAPPAKHHQTDPDSPEEILTRLTHADLKACVKTILKDSVGGPVARAKLQAFTEKAWAADRAKLKKDAAQIKANAEKKVKACYSYGIKSRNMGEIDEWGHAIKPFLPDAIAIWKKAPKLDGPAVAFDLLVDLATLALAPGDGDRCRVCGEGDENDGLYGEIESLFVKIALETREAYEDGAEAWLRDPQTVAWSGQIKELNQSFRPKGGIRSFSNFQYEKIAGLLRTGKIVDESPPAEER